MFKFYNWKKKNQPPVYDRLGFRLAGAKKNANRLFVRAMNAREGAMYVDEGGNMLIAVVVGMLLLVGIYTLFKTGIIPNITTKTNAMFTYTA